MGPGPISFTAVRNILHVFQPNYKYIKATKTVCQSFSPYVTFWGKRDFLVPYLR